MKRLLSLAGVAAFALLSAATPLLASAFGLCYDRGCGCHCGTVCRQPNAFTGGCCGNDCGGCGFAGYGWCGSPCCGGKKDCWLDRWACHRCEKNRCPPVYGWGSMDGGMGGYTNFGYDGAVDGNMVDGGVMGGGVASCPCKQTTKEPPVLGLQPAPTPLAPPKMPPAVSGYYPYTAPQYGMTPQYPMQPVSYQTGYQGYPSPMGYAPAPAWGYYPPAAYYPPAGYYQPPTYYQPNYYQQPAYYPSPAPSYWNPMGQ